MATRCTATDTNKMRILAELRVECGELRTLVDFNRWDIDDLDIEAAACAVRCELFGGDVDSVVDGEIRKIIMQSFRQTMQTRQCSANAR